MNFRPTKLKVIFSILIPVITWLIVFLIKLGAEAPKILINFFGLHNFTNLFSIGNIKLFLIEVVVVYLILSILFHRRHQHWNQPIKPLHNI